MSRARRDEFAQRLPAPTACPNCGYEQASIVCSICKTEKLPPAETAMHYATRSVTVPDDIQ